MSHVSMGEGCINPAQMHPGGIDYEACKLAAEQMGLEFVPGVTQFKWVGQWYNDYHAADAAYKQGIDPKDYGKCEHIFRFKPSMHEEETFAAHPEQRPNEIGLARKPDGSLAPIFDFYGLRGQELSEKVGGPGCKKLVELVNQCKIVVQAARQKGHSVKKVERLSNGKLHVVLGVKRPEKL